jgi:hypothetical protein
MTGVRKVQELKTPPFQLDKSGLKLICNVDIVCRKSHTQATILYSTGLATMTFFHLYTCEGDYRVHGQW